MCVPKNQGGTDFCNIHCFSLALLNQQAWRLLDNPDFLCATVLRAKYFRVNDLMNANLTEGPFLVGKALWHESTLWSMGICGELKMDRLSISRKMMDP